MGIVSIVVMMTVIIIISSVVDLTTNRSQPKRNPTTVASVDKFADIKRFLREIFPDVNDRRLFLTSTADTPRPNVQNWVGDYATGKSTMQRVVEAAFDRTCILPIDHSQRRLRPMSYLLKDTGRDLINGASICFVNVDVPGHAYDHFRTAYYLKMFVSGNSTTGRKLYSREEYTFAPSCKFVITTLTQPPTNCGTVISFNHRFKVGDDAKSFNDITIKVLGTQLREYLTVSDQWE